MGWGRAVNGPSSADKVRARLIAVHAMGRNPMSSYVDWEGLTELLAKCATPKWTPNTSFVRCLGVSKAAIVTAALLLGVLAIQFWPTGDRQAQKRRADSTQSLARRGAASDRACGRAVLQDWVRDGQIDGPYPRRCYEAARRMLPEEGHALYGSGGSLIDALDRKLGLPTKMPTTEERAGR